MKKKKEGYFRVHISTCLFKRNSPLNSDNLILISQSLTQDILLSPNTKIYYHVYMATKKKRKKEGCF